MEVSFLEAGVPLQKTFFKENNKVSSSSYPMVKNFTSTSYTVSGGMADLCELIKEHALSGHCLIKGELTRDLDQESRAGATISHSMTDWICLDFDGVKDTTLAELLKKLKLDKFDHIIQYSSKMGVVPEIGVSAHVFFELETPALPASLKQWLKHQNLVLPILKEQLELTKDKNQLRWPLDVTVCQNDKLIYITPPVTRGVKDSFKGERITFVKGTKPKIPASVLGLEKIKIEDVEHKQKDAINELRAKEGLEAKDLKTKIYRQETVVASPDAAVVTGLKEERGFTYLNINGGDSWGYYHPSNNPHIIRNFKGEDAFATKDLLPDYYESAQERAKEVRQIEKEEIERNTVERKQEDYLNSLIEAQDRTDGTSVFVANDRITDSYFMIEYHHKDDQLNLYRTGSRQKLIDFMMENGEHEPAFIPNWTFEFAFDNPQVFDPKRQWVNIYRQTDLLRDASEYLASIQKRKPRTAAKPPKTCEKIIRHVLGDDQQVYEDFINWLAYLLQKRKPPRSAWIIQGIQGTGKGALFNAILTPILGDEYCTPTSIQAMETQYNGWLKDSLMVLLDESKTDNMTEEAEVLERMKVYVKEPYAQLRMMRTDHKKYPIFASFIITSNNRNRAWRLEETDRRYHVAPYQEKRLELTLEEEEAVAEELPQLLKFLMEWQVDEVVAVNPRETEHKLAMKHVSRTAIDSVVLAMRTGDIDFFVEHAPMDYKAAINDPSRGVSTMAYIRFLDSIMEWRAGDTSQPLRVHRDTVRDIMEYLVGKIPDTPNKFTSMMKHHDVVFVPRRMNGSPKPCIEISMNVSDEVAEYWATYKGESEANKKIRDITSGKPSQRKRG